MVKNAGGNKSKKVARKNVLTTSAQDVRKAIDTNEMYAAITKIYSSQRCSVIGADGHTYQCTIRGKFLKNKRSGEGLINGSWVLIGFYDWEVRSDGSKKCDLLEIYSNLEKDKLKQTEARHLAELIKIDDNSNDGRGGTNCTFSNFHIESSGDEEEKEEKKIVAVVDTSVAVILPIVNKKETPAEQLDWLNISVHNI